jgi:aspartyl/asparaginyl beta-hydroxylase (cupin superfamily)
MKDEARRFAEYIELFADPSQDPRFARYPDLPSTPLYDSCLLPIPRLLEANFDEIRKEFFGLRGGFGFQPEGENIQRNGTWNVFFLYEQGRKNERNCRRVPVTTKLAESEGVLRSIQGLVYFSVMAPGTRISPHRGPTNIRIRCHLGLYVPPDCGMRVGSEMISWKEGKCTVFDDTFEHEVWNNSKEPRAVLVVDLWHPSLTAFEISLLKGLHRFAYGHATDLTRYWNANVNARHNYYARTL